MGVQKEKAALLPKEKAIPFFRLMREEKVVALSFFKGVQKEKAALLPKLYTYRVYKPLSFYFKPENLGIGKRGGERNWK